MALRTLRGLVEAVFEIDSMRAVPEILCLRDIGVTTDTVLTSFGLEGLEYRGST